METTMNFINESGLEFTDISSEQFREYAFANDEILRIENPLKLHVSESGGHRIFDAQGNSFYVPKGWLHLRWQAKEGQPNFVK
jgi:hypothetical protein